MPPKPIPAIKARISKSHQQPEEISHSRNRSNVAGRPCRSSRQFAAPTFHVKNPLATCIHNFFYYWKFFHLGKFLGMRLPCGKLIQKIKSASIKIPLIYFSIAHEHREQVVRSEERRVGKECKWGG